MKEYVVVLKRDADTVGFQADMVQSTGRSDKLHSIPDRSIDIANPRLMSKRSTHYALEDHEVEQIKQDYRVVDVHIPPDQDDSLEIGLHAKQDSRFDKILSSFGIFVNWGLRRCIESTNVYGSSSQNPDGIPTPTGGGYTYNLVGTGVDVVIQDSGLQVDHPEFNDVNGVSRVQQINWYAASGLSGIQSANHYRDYDGHGTHVEEIPGITYGWAKNARIYAVKVAGLEGSGDSGTGIREIVLM